MNQHALKSIKHNGEKLYIHDETPLYYIVSKSKMPKRKFTLLKCELNAGKS